MRKIELEAATRAVLNGIEKHLVREDWVNAPLIRAAAMQIAFDALIAADIARGGALVKAHLLSRRRKEIRNAAARSIASAPS